MLQHGKAIKAAAPGSKIVLAVKVRHTHPGHLHYRWTSDTSGLVASDAAPSVTMTMPAMPMAVEVFVEITNGSGGFLKLYITIPVKSFPPPRTAFLRLFISASVM